MKYVDKNYCVNWNRTGRSSEAAISSPQASSQATTDKTNQFPPSLPCHNTGAKEGRGQYLSSTKQQPRQNSAAPCTRTQTGRGVGREAKKRRLQEANEGPTSSQVDKWLAGRLSHCGQPARPVYLAVGGPLVPLHLVFLPSSALRNNHAGAYVNVYPPCPPTHPAHDPSGERAGGRQKTSLERTIPERNNQPSPSFPPSFLGVTKAKKPRRNQNTRTHAARTKGWLRPEGARKQAPQATQARSLLHGFRRPPIPSLEAANGTMAGWAAVGRAQAFTTRLVVVGVPSRQADRQGRQAGRLPTNGNVPTTPPVSPSLPELFLALFDHAPP